MDKRKFLYYNLHKIEHNKLNVLSDYIDKNEIQYSKNSNGILLNLSKLDDKHVEFFYDLYNLENKNYQYEPLKPSVVSKNKRKIIDVTYKDFNTSPLEKLILSYSY
jgi:hypothetical protein